MGLGSYVGDLAGKVASLKEDAQASLSKVCGRLSPEFRQPDTQIVLKEATPVSEDIVNLYNNRNLATRPFTSNVLDVLNRRLSYPYYGYKILAVQALVDRKLGENRVNIRGNRTFWLTAASEDQKIIASDEKFGAVQRAVLIDGSITDTLCDTAGQ